MDTSFGVSEPSILNHRLFYIFVCNVSFYTETVEIARYGDDYTGGLGATYTIEFCETYTTEFLWENIWAF